MSRVSTARFAAARLRISARIRRKPSALRRLQLAPIVGAAARRGGPSVERLTRVVLATRGPRGRRLRADQPRDPHPASAEHRWPRSLRSVASAYARFSAATRSHLMKRREHAGALFMHVSVARFVLVMHFGLSL